MRLKIAAKIGLGFGIITVAVIINAWVTSKTLEKSRNINETIMNVYTPSQEYISELYTKISDSRMLIKSWVSIDHISDTPDKLKLKSLHETDYKMVMDTLKQLSQLWDSVNFRKQLYHIDSVIVDSLFPKHQYIMSQLNSLEKYDDTFIVFEVTPMTEEGGDVMVLTHRVLQQIDKLRKSQDAIVEKGRQEMLSTFNRFQNWIFIMGLILVVGAIIVGVLVINSLVVPINRTKNILQSMGRGVLPKDKLEEGTDELGQMAGALNNLVKGLTNIFNFSVDIGKGNFDSHFEPLSDEDVLGHSLLEMRNELKKAADEEDRRKEEDEHRNWAAQGVAKFSDILRTNTNDLGELSYNIISNLVKYTNSNQGGLYIVNDNDKNDLFIEMKASYAFDRRKFITKRIEIGEGLVGRCYQEKERIYLTDIPHDYMKITSGLGEDSPKALLIVPLVYNDVIYGLIEIASFENYPAHVIEFIERIGESIAATISSSKAQIQTALLLEQSQQQAEEMSSQEEEMRQNMEELRATQEQSARREEELSREVNDLRKRIKELTQ
ncbi:MAG TPA: GAF domain-containing protein [Bacteroidales bacterium]|nr:GAF domain-containing protein [Bacteroidales bacterium]